MYLLIILFLLLPSFLFSQHVSGWQNYTDMKNVRSVVIDENNIWGASEGGAFSYNINSGSYTKFSKVE
jgi:hypothetical protein